MNRLHLHISVKDLAESITFYSTIFGANPTVEKHDYAKWRLTDPAVNFAISNRSDATGLNHLGIQVDSANELEKIAERLKQAKITTSAQNNSSCCYARSDKYWTTDPQGIAWESFHTLEDIPMYGASEEKQFEDDSSTCCAPDKAKTSSCC